MPNPAPKPKGRHRKAALAVEPKDKQTPGTKPGSSMWGRRCGTQSVSAPIEFFALIKKRPENEAFRLELKALIDRFSPIQNKSADN